MNFRKNEISISQLELAERQSEVYPIRNEFKRVVQSCPCCLKSLSILGIAGKNLNCQKLRKSKIADEDFQTQVLCLPLDEACLAAHGTYSSNGTQH
ncbi:hypothetical protein P3S67_013894 [Capsicum chacoense]